LVHGSRDTKWPLVQHRIEQRRKVLVEGMNLGLCRFCARRAFSGLSSFGHAGNME
jgi:L-lysine 2,3-aminomutase